MLCFPDPLDGVSSLDSLALRGAVQVRIRDREPIRGAICHRCLLPGSQGLLTADRLWARLLLAVDVVLRVRFASLHHVYPNLLLVDGLDKASM